MSKKRLQGSQDSYTFTPHPSTKTNWEQSKKSKKRSK